MIWCLFFMFNSVQFMFAHMVPLSQKVFSGMLIVTPNMLNLYRRASLISTVLLISVNSDPNVDSSTKLCLFLDQMIYAVLHNNNMPVWYLLVLLSSSCLVSTKQFVSDLYCIINFSELRPKCRFLYRIMPLSGPDDLRRVA